MITFISKSALLQTALLIGAQSNVTAFAPLKTVSRSNGVSVSSPLSLAKKGKIAFFADVKDDSEVSQDSTVIVENISVEDAKDTPQQQTDQEVVVTDGMPDFEIDQDLRDELKTLAKELNPLVGFYDPLQLSQAGFWSLSNGGTVGFLRQAEIKHGRVAMAAFVGYCVQSNWHWPWNMSLDGSPVPSIDLSPEAQWDAIPLNAKLQMITVIGFLEFWDELGGNIAQSSALGMEERVEMPHYTKGRMPGKYPSFKNFRDVVHWVPDLYDPFGNIAQDKKFTEEKKERGRLAEINNGRLAMLGIMSFLVADKVPGAVPLLKDFAQSYDGNVMIPFSNDFSLGIGLVQTVKDGAASSGASEAIGGAIEFVSQPIEVTSNAAPSVVVEKAAEDGGFVSQLLNSN